MQLPSLRWPRLLNCFKQLLCSYHHLSGCGYWIALNKYYVVTITSVAAVVEWWWWAWKHVLICSGLSFVTWWGKGFMWKDISLLLRQTLNMKPQNQRNIVSVNPYLLQIVYMATTQIDFVRTVIKMILPYFVANRTLLML